MEETLEKLCKELKTQRTWLRNKIQKILELNKKLDYDFTQRVIIAKGLDVQKMDIWVIVPGSDSIRNYYSETLYYYGDSDNGDYSYYNAKEIPREYLKDIAIGIAKYSKKLQENYKREIKEIKDVSTKLYVGSVQK